MISGGHNHKGAANHQQLTLPINKLIIHHICIHRTIFPGLTWKSAGAAICACIMESTEHTTNAAKMGGGTVHAGNTSRRGSAVVGMRETVGGRWPYDRVVLTTLLRH